MQQRLGLLLQAEAEAGGVARGAQSPGGIVGERAWVQDPQQTGFEVSPPAEGVDRFWRALQGQGDRVDGEVPPRQIRLDLTRRRHVGQRSRMRVGLGAGGCDVDLVPVELRLRRGEAFVLDRLGPQPRRQPCGIADDDQVDVGAAAAEQQVAHGTADQVDRIVARRSTDGIELGMGAAKRLRQVVDRRAGHAADLRA